LKNKINNCYYLYPLPSLPPSLSRSFSEAKHGGRSLYWEGFISPLGERRKGVKENTMKYIDFRNIRLIVFNIKFLLLIPDTHKIL